jgi:hypothetical protein
MRALAPMYSHRRHARPYPQANTLLSGLSVSADVLAPILLTTARTLWTDRRRVTAAVAWALWTINDRGRPHGHGRLCRAQRPGYQTGTVSEL